MCVLPNGSFVCISWFLSLCFVYMNHIYMYMYIYVIYVCVYLKKSEKGQRVRWVGRIWKEMEEGKSDQNSTV